MDCSPPDQMTITITDVQGQGQDRAQDGHELSHPNVALGEILVGFFEALALMAGTNESLDHTHPGNIFLQDGIELVQFLLHGQKHRPHLDAEDGNDGRGDESAEAA